MVLLKLKQMRLATLMAMEIAARGALEPELLIPVPMHRKRLQRRGYNQAALLCRHLSDELTIPWSHKLVAKCRDTRPQASLTLKQRQHNLRGCFTVTAKHSPSHICIIDDVLTTGATAQELAQTLRKQGARQIQVWTLAHAL